MMRKLKAIGSEARYARTLEQAMQVAGGEEQLARILHTSPDLLRRWLAGHAQPPLNKYITALQLVTRRTRAQVG